MVRLRSGNGQDMLCQGQVNVMSVSGLERSGQCQVKDKFWSWSPQVEDKVKSGQVRSA